MRGAAWRRAGVSVVLGALASALVIVPATQASAVAHGNPAVPGQYGFAVKLTFQGIPRPDGSTYDSACSGVLVAPSWVLTAGHCFHDAYRNPVSGPQPYRSATALVGQVDEAGSGGHVLAITSAWQAPSGDVALAKLSSPAWGVPPIAVAKTPPQPGETLRLTGWGATTSNGRPSSHLNTGLVQISRLTSTLAFVHGAQPAADTSACPYDSGAPYFREQGGTAQLVSIESGGPSCPHPNDETTTRADVLSQWITTTTALADNGRTYSLSNPAASGNAVLSSGGCDITSPTPARLSTPDATFASQRWVFTTVAVGYVTVATQCPTPQYLSAPDNTAITTTRTYTSAASQQWAITVDTTSRVRLTNRGSGHVLDLSTNTPTQKASDPSSPSQRWTFQPLN